MYSPQPENTRNNLVKNQFFWSLRQLFQGKFDMRKLGLQEYSYNILTQTNLSSTCTLGHLGPPENLKKCWLSQLFVVSSWSVFKNTALSSIGVRAQAWNAACAVVILLSFYKAAGVFQLAFLRPADLPKSRKKWTKNHFTKTDDSKIFHQ